MHAFIRRAKSPTALFFACVIVVSTLVATLSWPYFTKRVFFVDDATYALNSAQGQTFTYRSSKDGAPPIEVRIEDQDRRSVRIGGDSFDITDLHQPYVAKYEIAYPNARHFTVEDQSGNLIPYDEKGEIYFPLSMYVNGKRQLEEGDETYAPSALIAAAYPQYHEKRGLPFVLFVSLALFIYGWCGYRYRKFQDFHFWISLRWIWVEDPEPSDFYYFMSKIGGIATMVIAFFLAFKAY